MYIGSIDIGGTKTIVAVTSNDGSVISKIVFPTEIKDCYKTFDMCCEHLRRFTAEMSIDISDLYGIGINVPGMYSPMTQTLIKAPFASWENVAVGTYFKKHIGHEHVFVDNDVKICALGEKYFGYQDTYQNYVWITVSTGIGGAIVQNGEILRGANNLAGEIGHLKVSYGGAKECSCGAYGCLEAHASGTAVTQQVSYETQRDDSFRDEFESRSIPIDAKGCSILAGMGIAKAIAIYDQMADYLARGIGAVINLLNPQVVILGGGVADSIDMILPLLRQHIKQYALEELCDTPIVQTKLGYEAALIGTIALVIENMQIHH